MKPEIRDNAGLQKRFIREAVLSRKVRQENVAAVADAAYCEEPTVELWIAPPGGAPPMARRKAAVAVG
jgi:hypothetical protein